ncbi:MAG TPA: hypothetical protein VNZ49_01380 [Bacteroidia bacterium]|jgi:hypothetical protein|nr:hypothetical protein [Bacteroidia bacterium]
MKKLRTFYLLLSAWISVRAQHCPFDGSAILVLNIHSADSAGIIPGLKIYLEDSLGKPFFSYRYMDKKWVNDTVWFRQNPDHTTFRGYIDNNNPTEIHKIRFPFARNNYVTTVYDGFPIEKYKIKIADTDGVANGGWFQPKTSVLTDRDVYPLCTTYNDEVYNCPFKKIVYKPADVILVKK